MCGIEVKPNASLNEAWMKRGRSYFNRGLTLTDHARCGIGVH